MSRGRHGLGVLASAVTVALWAAPMASAGEAPPGGNSNYHQRRDHAGPDRASSVETTSCVGPDGEVYHRRRAASADDKGQNTATTVSGDPTACGNQMPDHPRRVLLGGPDNPLLNVSTGEINVLSPGHEDR
jgi:hypothetical protein